MTLKPPPERPLPDPEAVLRRVLDEVAAPGRRTTRAAASRWVLPLVAAVVVALVALGAIGLLGGRRPSALPAGPGTGAPSTATRPPAVAGPTTAGQSTGPTPVAGVVVSSDGTITWGGTDVTLEPPGDRRPALSASAAVAAYCGKGACDLLGEPQVTLGLATTHGSGTARPDGSIAPLLDRALVYALQWQSTCSPSHMPQFSPSPRTTPVAADPSPCTRVALVDPGTAVELFSFDYGTTVTSPAPPPGETITSSTGPGRPLAAGAAVAAETVPLGAAEAFGVATTCLRGLAPLGVTTAGLTVLGSARLPASDGAPAGADGSQPGGAVLARTAGGAVVSCALGRGRVVVGPVALTRQALMPTTLPTTDATTPVKELLGAGTGGAASSGGPSSLTVGTWFVVAPEVASMRTRVTVGGVVGPWVVSSAVDGFLYRRVSIPSIPATGFVAETEVVTRDGRAIDVAGVTGRTTTLG